MRDHVKKDIAFVDEGKRLFESGIITRKAMTLKKLVAPSLPKDGQVACSHVRCRHPFDIEIKSDGSRYKTCPRCRAKERKI